MCISCKPKSWYNNDSTVNSRYIIDSLNLDKIEYDIILKNKLKIKPTFKICKITRLYTLGSTISY